MDITNHITQIALSVMKITSYVIELTTYDMTIIQMELSKNNKQKQRETIWGRYGNCFACTRTLEAIAIFQRYDNLI